jgi:WD40 repeat protein
MVKYIKHWIWLYVSLVVLFSRADDGMLQVITAESGGMIVELDQYTDMQNYFSDVAFNPIDGELAVIAVDNELGLFHDGEVRFLNPETWEEAHHFDEPLTGISIAYSGNGTLFAVGNGIGEDIGRLRVIDLITSEIIFDQRIETAEILDIAFSPSQDYVAVGLGNAQVLDVEIEIGYAIIDLRSGEIIFSPPEPFGVSVDFLDSSTLVVQTGVNQTSVIQVWDFLNNELIYQVDDVLNVGRGVIVLNNERFIYEGIDAVYSVSSLQEVDIIQSQIGRNFIRSITYHPSQPIIAIGYERRLQNGIPADRDGVIRLVEIDTGDELAVLEGHLDIVTSLAFSPDGTLLASGGTDGTVRLWGIPGNE